MSSKTEKEKSFPETVAEIYRGKPRTRKIAVSKSKRARQHIREIENK
jgi:hypothetical protein